VVDGKEVDVGLGLVVVGTMEELVVGEVASA